MWLPALSTALGVAQWLTDERKRKDEEVPEQVLTDDYFAAMAEDIEERLDDGQKLKKALRDIYEEQGPVLLRPAPKRNLNGWMLPLVASGAAVGFALLRRRG